MPNLYTSLSALNVGGVAMQVTSNNIANMNTNGFKSSRTHFETGQHDSGVRVAGIYRDMSAGPAVINDISRPDGNSDRMTASELADRETPRVQNAILEAQGFAKQEELRQINHGREVQASNDQFFTELSNVDVAREFSTMVALEAMYSANAAAVRAQDEMTGSLLNLIV